jgi:hypothetical protein
MFVRVRPPIFTFAREHLLRQAEALRDEYRNGRPFPHVVVDDFLPADVATRLVEAFPPPQAPHWLDWRMRDTQHQPKKLGIGHASRLEGAEPYLHNILFAFNSSPFLSFLEALTAIEKLLPDPHLHGAGLHQILSGGKLALHADSTVLSPLNLYRRINVLLYLNQGWKADYGGDLELWNEDCTRREKAIAPLFNRLVVFNTTKTSFHGHPSPLNTPEEVTRKSLALYYFTSAPSADDRYDENIDWRETSHD